MLKSAIKFILPFLIAVSAISANAQSVKDSEVAVVVATLLNASKTGRTIHVDGDFGAKRADGSFTGLDRISFDTAKLYRSGGQWFVEVIAFVQTPITQKGLDAITIDGVKLLDVIAAKSIRVTKSQLELVRGVQQVIVASMEGYTVSVRGNFGARLENGKYSGVDVVGVSGTAISSNGGKYSFQMPTYVHHTDLSNIEISGVSITKRRALLRTCEGVFLPSI